MARSASRALVRNSPPGVVEGCRGPVRRSVASGACAGRRKSVAGVVRNISAQRGGALPLRRMATVAIGWWRRGSDVAQIARHGDVRAGQRKSSGVVVKRCAKPGSGCMAGRACGGIPQRDVIRH